jgi:P27 family predicted phage terminase small subunit
MGKGRKSTADSIKRMRGTDQPCRLKEVNMPVIPIVTKLPPPKNLGKTGTRIYKTVGKMLMNLNILNELNFPQFYQYCKETELYYDIMAEMPNTEDLIHSVFDKQLNLTTKTKALRKIAESALNNSKILASEFGLTPSAQAKIMSRVNTKPKSALDSFFTE